MVLKSFLSAVKKVCYCVGVVLVSCDAYSALRPIVNFPLVSCQHYYKL